MNFNMMKKYAIKHYALIPAKAISSRYVNKNWRNFFLQDNLVEYAIKSIPRRIFKLIILSTDRVGVKAKNGITIHHRAKRLATAGSHVNDLIGVIIAEYNLPEDGYIWLLNPTSPFRSKKDFFRIRKLLAGKTPGSVISAAEINSFIWKDSTPIFNTEYPRKNMQDIDTEYHVENGQFIVFRIVDFLKTRTWYFKDTLLFKQRGIEAAVDIDTLDDFLDAQKLARRR